MQTETPSQGPAASRTGTIVEPAERAMNEPDKQEEKIIRFFRKIRCYIFHKKESFSNFASEKSAAPPGRGAAETEEV
ncbi:MAG: hypothetical protein K2L06_02405 [Alistipes sp.]|nr:hypothetical protein [Alistipes sp.]